MLSTLIIAASLTTGDTLDYSITKTTYDGLGQVDETLAFVGDNSDKDNKGQISLHQHAHRRRHRRPAGGEPSHPE